MSFREEEYVMLSALQHYVFCPRQCALIHNERLWAENGLTALGRIEHKRVDSVTGTTHGRVRTARSIRLVCHRLGIQGVADAVEYESFEKQGEKGCICRITPVEYKHGHPKENKADEVQLCAQALCLEERHGIHIESGYLYYHGTRRRKEVMFDKNLREWTERAISATRQLLLSGQLPPAYRTADCDACSLLELCLPLPKGVTATGYNERNFSILDEE